MNILSPKEIIKILNYYGLKRKKSLGQNFLINKNVLEKIIQAAEIKKTDKIIEIGPGLGVLTEKLCQKAGEVLAIEKDEKLAEILQKITASYHNLKIIKDDVLKILQRKEELENYGFKNYKVVANLPYNITSPVLKKFLSFSLKPSLMVLMIQKEVAERITGREPKNSILSLAVQFYGKAEIIDYVDKRNFWPSPQVDSAIIKIKDIGQRNKIDEKYFFQTIKIAFASPRKTLINNLSAGFRIDKDKVKKIICKLNWSEKIRAQELSLSMWQNLINELEKIKVYAKK